MARYLIALSITVFAISAMIPGDVIAETCEGLKSSFSLVTPGKGVQATRVREDQQWMNEAGLAADLKRVHHEYLQDQAKSLRNVRGIKKPGQKIRIGLLSYEVVRVLGIGGEGSVYLVRSKQDLMVLKHFNNRSNALESVRELTELSNKGVPAPGILGWSRFGSKVLMEYVEGVPVTDLIEFSSLSTAQKQIIRRQWQQFINRYPDRWFLRLNVILDLKTGGFVLFDAH